MAELDRRLAQFAEDVARERALVADAEAALEQLAPGRRDAAARRRGRARSAASGVDARATAADSVVAAAEKTFGELTGAARRPHRAAQPADADRARAGRARRPDRKRDRQYRGGPGRDASESRPDLAALAAAVESAQAAIGQGRAGGARRRSRPQRCARKRPRCRAPPARRRRARGAAARHRSQDADEAAGGRDPEHVAAGDRQASPSRRATKSRSARRSATISMRRSIRATRCAGRAPRSIPPTRRCRRACSRLPSTSRRRRSWPAVSPRSASSSAPTARACVAQLKPGQRLVSRDGDLWRWDGFAADAHAPTGAARRLAQRSRLADIDGELVVSAHRGRRQAQGRRDRAGRP